MGFQRYEEEDRPNGSVDAVRSQSEPVVMWRKRHESYDNASGIADGHFLGGIGSRFLSCRPVVPVRRHRAAVKRHTAVLYEPGYLAIDQPKRRRSVQRRNGHSERSRDRGHSRYLPGSNRKLAGVSRGFRLRAFRDRSG